MWPIKEKENGNAAHIVAKSYPLYLAVKMRRFGSLININPSGSKRRYKTSKMPVEISFSFQQNKWSRPFFISISRIFFDALRGFDVSKRTVTTQRMLQGMRFGHIMTSYAYFSLFSHLKLRFATMVCKFSRYVSLVNNKYSPLDALR